MKRLIRRKSRTKRKRTLHRQPDSHNWATKMEIRCLLSGKPDLKLNQGERQAV
jgi:hypothetical protein